MAGCHVLSKSIVNIFILNLNFRPRRESDSEIQNGDDLQEQKSHAASMMTDLM